MITNSIRVLTVVYLLLYIGLYIVKMVLFSQIYVSKLRLKLRTQFFNVRFTYETHEKQTNSFVQMKVKQISILE